MKRKPRLRLVELKHCVNRGGVRTAMAVVDHPVYKRLLLVQAYETSPGYPDSVARWVGCAAWRLRPSDTIEYLARPARGRGNWGRPVREPIAGTQLARVVAGEDPARPRSVHGRKLVVALADAGLL